MARTRPLFEAITKLQGKRRDAEFARDLGVHRNYPGRWKRGIKPSTEHLQILVAHGLDSVYLLGDAAAVKPDAGEAA